jgi:quinol monooxygenase YgiN
MEKVRLTIVATLEAKPGKEAQLRTELLRLVAPTREEQGCVQYDLHESNEQPGLFLFFENWVSASDLETHLQSPHISVLRSKEAELLAKPVHITHWTRIA